MVLELPVIVTSGSVQLVANDDEFDALEPEWEELLGSSDNGSFFLRWAWCRRWWATYSPSGSRLYILACRGSDGRLLGLAPLYWQQRYYGGVPHIRELDFIGTGVRLKTSEHLDVLARPGFEQVVAVMMVQFLEKQRDWDRIYLWGLDEGSVMLGPLLTAIGPRARTNRLARLPWIRTDADWPAVRENMARGLRKNVDNRARSLSRSHTTTFERVHSRDELRPAYADFVRLHQMRWATKGEPGSFAIPRFETFLFEAMKEALDAGLLRFWTLRIDGQCAAVLIAFLHQGRAHFFQTGFDPSYAKYSIGSLIIAQSIQDCIADPQIVEFDFMGGDRGYKDWWTPHSRKAVELVVYRPSWRSSLYRGGLAVRRRLGRLKRALLVRRA